MVVMLWSDDNQKFLKALMKNQACINMNRYSVIFSWQATKLKNKR